MEEEIWKDVKGYEGLYKISSLGRVYSVEKDYIDVMGRHIVKNGRYMKVKISKQTGYPYLGLSKKGKQKQWCIHRLIAEAFIPNPNNLPCVNHIDENRANSVLSNLEWCTYGYNCIYGSAREKRRNKLLEYYKTHGKPCAPYRQSFSVIKYSLKGKLLTFYKGGLPEIEKEAGKRLPSIANCLAHRSKSAYGFVWRYSDDDFSYSPPKKKGANPTSSIVEGWGREIIEIDKDGKEIRKFKSTSKAALFYGFDRHLFSKAKEVDGIKQIKGMLFKTIRKRGDNFVPKGHKGPRPDLKGFFAKPVNQYTLDGCFIQRFSSIKEAAQSVGRKQGGDITNCCKGNLKTAYGFKWGYA